MKKLLFLVHVDWGFICHRLPIAIEAQKKGYEVHIAAGITDKKEELLSYGFLVHDLPIKRSSINLFSEMKLLKSIYSLVKETRPDVIHLVTIKPVIYGGLISRILKVKNVVAAIPGLGSIFTNSDWKAKLIKPIISQLYKQSLSHPNMAIIFQNESNRSIIETITNIDRNKTYLIPGSGIDLAKYKPNSKKDNKKITITMASRLLYSKGVLEFIEASKAVKHNHVVFQLAGTPDPDNRYSVSEADFEEWKTKDHVKILGHIEDIPSLLEQSDIFILPSYYGEGLSKALIEAAACGLAVITTDMPGCRDAIIPNVTGLLIPPRDTTALVSAIEKLVNDDDLRKNMGDAGRKLAEERYSIEQVVATHLAIYQKLWSKA